MSITAIAFIVIAGVIIIRCRGDTRPILVYLHRAYCIVIALITSLISIAIALGFLWAGWKVIQFDWPHSIAPIVGVLLILIGLSKLLGALPGITPGVRTGGSGDARAAGLRDVRRSGIFGGY